ncbi:MAG: hypothetical protein JW819_04940 [Candidatus Krumholzibacteriota bacterium]|nr:hypothetical protein [Candidatus Krumholzibacteriota bacterium]
MVNAKRMNRILTALLAMLLLGINAAAEQWEVALAVLNGGGESQALVFGIHPDGTDGVDPELGEVGLPPWPPGAIFDVRFLVDDAEGLRRDIRDDSPVERTHEIQWQAGACGYPIILRWDPAALPAATFALADGYGGIFIAPFDMAGADSLLIPLEQSFIRRLDLTVLPGTVPPEAPVITPAIPDLAIFTGQQFPALRLDDYVADPDTPDAALSWTAGGAGPPWLDISPERVLAVSAPPGWMGSESFTLTVTDPDGLEDTQDLLVSCTPGGLPRWSVPVAVVNGARGAGLVSFGLHPDATDGIDSALDEVALPPWPPSSVFDARLLLPDGFTHSAVDLRHSEQANPTYHIQWQAGEEGYPVTVSWPGELPPGEFTIADDKGGIHIPPTDMSGTQSLEVPDSLSAVTGLIISAVPVIDLTPPAGPTFLHVLDHTADLVTLAWDEALEEHFAFYEILHDSVAFSDEAAWSWDWSEDPEMAQIETTEMVVPLPAGVTTAYFRIRAWDLFGNSGPLSDPVAITDAPLVPGGQGEEDMRLLSCAPHPFSLQTTVRFLAPRGAVAELTVYDLRGRRVWTRETVPAAGSGNIIWNGMDDRGRALPSGVYLCVLRSGGHADSRRIVLVR